MLMDVDWGDKLKLNFTSYGCMLLEIDWRSHIQQHLIVDVIWLTGKVMKHTQLAYNSSEVHWGCHGPSSNNINESLAL